MHQLTFLENDLQCLSAITGALKAQLRHVTVNIAAFKSFFIGFV